MIVYEKYKTKPKEKQNQRKTKLIKIPVIKQRK